MTHWELFNDNLKLEGELEKTGTELKRIMNFLNIADDQANQNRAKIRSPEDEVRLARDKTNPSIQSTVEIQRILEKLQDENQRLRTSNLQHLNNALSQKQRAVRAERDCELNGDRARALANSLAISQKKFQTAIGDVQRRLVHQTRRADQQREVRIRLEVENQELRQARPFVQRKREAIFI
ncbi:hypothetical protein RRF57_001697 [Xylaria bambusicola]|uniref:Uncharacterized protein n=1 Tax=Xylaria bambusicola TaxID=326684 RepID=A0AAN7UHM3_9PEZI